MNKFLSLSETISSDNKNLMIISHRGEWSTVPENSIASISLAANSGADMVEIDVQRTKFGKLFLMHDDTTDRMTNQTCKSIEVKDEEFETLFLRNRDGGPNSTLTDLHVPTLRNALETARGLIHVNIDTKHRRDLEAAAELVYEMGMQDQVLIKMVVDPNNPDISFLDTSWYKSLIFMPVLLKPKPGRMAMDALKMAELYNAKILEISFESLDELKETYEKTSKLGIRLWCNTLIQEHPLTFSDKHALENPEDVWGTLIRSGIGAIQTDQTPSLSRFIERR